MTAKAASAASRPVVRQRRSENMRNAILSAATQEFATKGFEGCAMRAVARTVGVELAHIQHHFGDKESLWAAVLASVIGKVRRTFDGAVESTAGKKPAQVIAALIDAIVRHAAEDPAFVALMFHARTTQSAHTDTLLREISPGMKQWKQLIELAQQQGDFVEGDAGILFYQMVGAALRIFSVAADAKALIGRSPSDPKTLDEHIRTCIRVFMPNHFSSVDKSPRRRRG